MFSRWSIAGLLAVATVAGTHLTAQSQRPLGVVSEDAIRIIPFFDGWTRNNDGTVSLSFGYAGPNRSTVEIPLGPDNVITPKEFDGRQPTSFPPVVFVPPVGQGDTSNIGAPAAALPAYLGTYGIVRERGTFTVSVPGDFKGDVVWTLRYQGQTWTVPGRTKATAYELSWPMAMGSVPPRVRFQPNGSAGRGPAGLQGPALEARVGQPVELAVWLHDDGIHEKEPIPVKRDLVPSMNATWFKHSGPVGGQIEFKPAKQPIADVQGRATTMAVFSEPGEYVVRVRGDSFGNIDSTPDDQCCWTNGYWKVRVTR